MQLHFRVTKKPLSPTSSRPTLGTIGKINQRAVLQLTDKPYEDISYTFDVFGWRDFYGKERVGFGSCFNDNFVEEQYYCDAANVEPFVAFCESKISVEELLEAEIYTGEDMMGSGYPRKLRAAFDWMVMMNALYALGCHPYK